jgi:uncharacterized protein YeaO (DUF488 family)
MHARRGSGGLEVAWYARHMSLRIVQLGSARAAHEGTRIGTVRRPPRGVPKQDWAKRDFYDVWLPELAPSDDLLKTARAAQDDKAWQTFLRHFRREMSRPEPQHLLQLLSVLSHTTDLSVGCYCENEAHCHRSLLRELFAALGARFA